MKKLLLGTSVLAAVAFAAVAQAETPKITVGGTSDFQFGHVSDDIVLNDRSKAFRSDNELSFKVDGKSSFGLGYGGEIVLEADTTNDSDGQGTNAARTYIYVDGGWGRVEAGSNLGAATTMKVDASRIARATGGIDGDWYYFTGANTGAQQFLATPDLFLDYGLGSFGSEQTENLNKISYYSPKFSGFQAGLTYIPDTENRGQGAGAIDLTKTAGQADNVYELALAYDGKFDDVGFAASGAYTAGSASLTGREDLRAWNVGAKATYMGFALAGSYGSWGDSLRTASNLDETNYFTVGGAYETGPFGVSVTYIDSEYAQSATTTNDFNNLSIGADYKLAPGLTPYAEVSFFEADGATAGATNDNDGTVILLGTMLNF